MKNSLREIVGEENFIQEFPNEFWDYTEEKQKINTLTLFSQE